MRISNIPPKNFIPVPFSYHAEVELNIDRLSNQGHGIGRINNWVIFVPFVLPGERVKAHIYKNHKNFSEADLYEILEASPHRTQAQCPLFGTCGGCQYQHIDYSTQLKIKTEQVQEAFLRIGGLDCKINSTIPSPKTYFYRNKLTPHFQKNSSNKAPYIGFLASGRKRTWVDVPFCPIADQKINDRLLQERARWKEKIPQLKQGATLLLRTNNGEVTSNPKAILSTVLFNKTFQFVAGEFFQTNDALLPQLIQFVLEALLGQKIKHLLDFYCGVGVFGLSYAEQFATVQGIELSPSTLALAKKNAQNNNISNARFIQGSAETFFEQQPSALPQSGVIIDPPRSGCSALFLHQLLQFSPQCIAYVSCAPDTQARDLKILSSAYEIILVQPFDCFPQTKHIENVALLRYR